MESKDNQQYSSFLINITESQRECVTSVYFILILLPITRPCYEWNLTLAMELLGIYKIRASGQTEYVTQALKSIKRQRKKKKKKKNEKIVRLTLQVLWKVWTQESFQK